MLQITTFRATCISLAGASLAAWSFPLAAQAGGQPPVEEEQAPIIVTATLDDPLADGVGGAYSLDAEEANALNPVSLLQTLESLPGVVAFEKGGAGAGSYLSVRGGEPNFALVTINGVRVNDPLQSSGGGFDFSLLSPADVASINVLTGPTSTVYGADALSGIVAIELGLGDGRNGPRARAGYGSDDRYELGASYSAAGFWIGASQGDTGAWMEGSTARRRTAALAASPRIGDAIAIDLFAMASDSDSNGYPEDSGGPHFAATDAQESRKRELRVVGATLSASLSQGLTAQVRASWTRSDLQSDSPGIAPGALDGVPPISSDSRFERFELATAASIALSSAAEATLGANLVREDGTSTGVLDFGFPIPTDYTLERSMPGLFVTARLGDRQSPSIEAGLRVDWPEHGSDGRQARWSPRIGARYPLGHSGIALLASYARGFKQPSMFALGFPLIANPELREERSETMDAGADWNSRNGAVGASLVYFRGVYRDLIDFDPELFTNVNRARVDVEGIELAFRGDAGPVRLSGSLTHMTSEAEDGATLRYRPEWTGRFAAQWSPVARVGLRLDAAFSGAFNDSSVPTGFVRQDGYATLGAGIRFEVAGNIGLDLALTNLTGEDYFRTVGMPEPGRRLFATISYGI